MSWKFTMSVCYKNSLPFFFSSISYNRSDENHITCDGPPMELPGEYTDKLNITYTYSVKFEVSIPCHHLTFFQIKYINIIYFITIKASIFIKVV